MHYQFKTKEELLNTHGVIFDPDDGYFGASCGDGTGSDWYSDNRLNTWGDNILEYHHGIMKICDSWNHARKVRQEHVHLFFKEIV